MRQLDKLHMKYPVRGYRKLTAYLRNARSDFSGV